MCALCKVRGQARWLAAQSLLPVGDCNKLPLSAVCLHCWPMICPFCHQQWLIQPANPPCRLATSAPTAHPALVSGVDWRSKQQGLIAAAARVHAHSICAAQTLTPSAATSSSPADCPAGSYNPGVGASTCQLCPAGTASQDTGALLSPALQRHTHQALPPLRAHGSQLLRRVPLHAFGS